MQAHQILGTDSFIREGAGFLAKGCSARANCTDPTGFEHDNGPSQTPLVKAVLGVSNVCIVMRCSGRKNGSRKKSIAAGIE
jgi:hypothetical protein